MWIAILDAAQEWGLAPWAVEDQASELWWERWKVLREERATYEAKRAQKE